MSATRITPMVGERKKSRKSTTALMHLVLGGTALIWLGPVLFALYTAFRPYADTADNGYLGIAQTLTLDNFSTALGELPTFYVNTAIITLPALVVTLLFASFIAYIVSRYSFRFNLPLLVLFTACNLLPQQVIIIPLFEWFNQWPLPQWLGGGDYGVWFDSYFGLIMIHIAFQTGFCTFVLSNYMKTLPKELDEAARVDGAGVIRHFFTIILPLCRPALAALATLEFTWIYNDFFWAATLMTTGDKLPITSAINNFKGEFFTDTNLIAAGSLLIAIPTMVVYFALQKQFIGGLTLGANKR